MGEVKKLSWKWTHAFLFITPPASLGNLDLYRDFSIVFFFSPVFFPGSSRQNSSCKHYSWEILGGQNSRGISGERLPQVWLLPKQYIHLVCKGSSPTA